MFYISRLLSAIMVVILSIALLILVTYIKYEPVETVTASIEAKIVRRAGGRTGIGSADPYFIAELASGETVKVRDFGEIPAFYTGKVYLKRVAGNVSGKRAYRIDSARMTKTFEARPDS